MNINIIKNKNIQFIFLIIKIIIILSFFSFHINIILRIKSIFCYLKSQIQFIKNENIFKYTNNNKLKILKKFKKIKNPKISIISPVFNSEKYILRFLKSIQSQNFLEIEIIFIDDASIDNSCKIIKKYINEDQRIILIKNKKNKGTFKNRNIGALYSKGKYIIIPDPDDILTNNILSFCYKYIEKYKIEMIRFNIYIGNGKISFNDIIKKIRIRPINQPELSTYIYYGNNELEIFDCYITNKFIKKEVFLRALNSINKFYLNMYITYLEDSLFNFILYRNAISSIILPINGYYYIKSRESITKNLFKISGLILKFMFVYLKILYEYSKNSKYEKDITNIIFTYLYKNNIMNKRISKTAYHNNFNFFNNIINIFLNSSFINQENKSILKNIRDKIIKENKY